MPATFSDNHPTLYVVSPWWNRLCSVLVGPGELAWLFHEPQTGWECCRHALEKGCLPSSIHSRLSQSASETVPFLACPRRPREGEKTHGGRKEGNRLATNERTNDAATFSFPSAFCILIYLITIHWRGKFDCGDGQPWWWSTWHQRGIVIFYILPGGDAECCARNGRTLELACADHYSISRETSCIPTRYKLLFGSFTTSSSPTPIVLIISTPESAKISIIWLILLGK